MSFKTTGEKIYSAKNSQIQESVSWCFSHCPAFLLGSAGTQHSRQLGFSCKTHRVQNVCRCGFGDQSCAGFGGKVKGFWLSPHTLHVNVAVALWFKAD